MQALLAEPVKISRYLNHWIRSSRNGHGVHSPFAYRLCEEVFYNPHRYYDFEELDRLRQALLANRQVLDIEDHGAGSKVLNKRSRKVCDIAAAGISTQRQSEILYKLSNFLGCSNTVELGTSLGLNALYLAKANPKGKVISVEGSPALANFATGIAAKFNAGNLRIVNDRFQNAFPEILNNIPSLDLLYVDGHHTREATLEYFNAALTKKHGSSVFVFDDIYWSSGMTETWKQISSHPDVRLSIDTFYSGYVFFSGEIKEKISFRFYI